MAWRQHQTSRRFNLPKASVSLHIPSLQSRKPKSTPWMKRAQSIPYNHDAADRQQGFSRPSFSLHSMPGLLWSSMCGSRDRFLASPAANTTERPRCLKSKAELREMVSGFLDELKDGNNRSTFTLTTHTMIRHLRISVPHATLPTDMTRPGTSCSWYRETRWGP